MNTVLSILAALLLLGVLITVHEFGHYIVGRLLGFTILEFSVGMGPVIFEKKKNGIRYCLRCLPIGGMCRFSGEADGLSNEDETAKTLADEEDETSHEGREEARAFKGDEISEETEPSSEDGLTGNTGEEVADTPDPGAFYAQKRWKRFLVIAAGPVMNILFAVLLAFVALFAYGDYLPAVVEEPIASMPAEVAGLQVGDVLLTVDGKSVSTVEDGVSLIRAANAEEVTLEIQRDGKKETLVLYDIYDAEAGYNRIGVSIGYARVRCGFFKALGGSFRYVWDVLRETFSFFGTLFRGEAEATDVSGVVGTVAIIGEAIRYGFESVLRLACLISASLAFTNLLPIPALDGGSMFFILVSAVIGKEIPPEKQGIINLIGLLLLLGLMVVVTVNDIRNLIG